MVGEPQEPAQGGARERPQTAYEEVFTVVHDLGEGRDIAWIRAPIWPPVGTVVELDRPKRHALVIGIRLVLEGERAVVRVDVQDPGEGELIARDAATRLLEEEDEQSSLAVGEAALEQARDTAS